jgi:hypothetical protein
MTEFLDSTKKRYGYDNWEKFNYDISNYKKFMINRSIFNGYSIINRSAMRMKYSYEDIYVSDENPQKRIMLKVVNLDSFEDAKEFLINYLSQCSAYKIPQLNEGGISYGDIGYGIFDETQSCAIFIKRNTFIYIASIGETHADISVFVKLIDLQISKIHK